MNPLIKERWLKALRSGKYKQGRGALRKNGGYCCLGVLCDLFRTSPEGKKRKAKWKRIKGVPTLFFKIGMYGSRGLLPYTVYNWAGLNSGNPIIAESDAINLNDKTQVGFKGIANRIEKNL